MSELEKLLAAIGHRPLTICHVRGGGGWYAELQIRDYPIHATGNTLDAAIQSAMCLVLDHAQEQGRDSEEHARRARDEVARLRAIVGEGK